MRLPAFRVPPGGPARLGRRDPAYTGRFRDGRAAEGKIREDCAELARLQDRFLAQESRALLLIFQGMDGAGKDGTIKFVMSSVDPQGCTVAAFKRPTPAQLRHDYLWRFVCKLPERGKIGIFNRSYYEEVLRTRVHPEELEAQKLPPVHGRRAGALWKCRFREINHLEEHLADNGTIILKFFLHISKAKQRERLLERTDLAEKKWKFSPEDLKERRHWNRYMDAYEEALGATSTRRAPWYVIPADNRWFSALAVAEIVVSVLKDLRLKYPSPTAEERREMSRARRKLLQERKPSRRS
ncbi:MAG: PPK2 family polyphosphate kinase [Thermoanaerobaculia bacterium]